MQRFHAIHRRIRGRLKHRAGNLNPETVYSGDDPDSKLWVYATYVDTVRKVYEKFIHPLTPHERSNYYSDRLVLARLVKIPEKIVPSTLHEFDLNMNQMLNGNTLAITDTARHLAHEVLYPDVGFLPAQSARMLRFVTAGLLPERLRNEYEFF